ncbi:response regulator [Larkinella soli]|uniref:response regulator n=1 Tax=Larkinella soli TaxID=1770527 RepID=UPI000FFB855B|nr:response regulator [Larkinella soli]
MNPPSKRAAKAEPRLLVLIIEDNQDHWLLMETALIASYPRLTLSRVASKAEAVAYLNQRQVSGFLPDLILLDLYLPDRQEGLSMLETIRSMPSPIQVLPVVIFSASAREEDIKECYQQGANSYIIKPHQAKEWPEFMAILLDFWGRTATLVQTDFID